ncbi:MAG: ABC transporter permease [Gammaproteobacteria bacterium]|nr:ABC transporter permease [Gammaproteobacteria bacterium]
MKAGDLIGFAGGAISAHRLRSGLTILGITVGIASVVLLTSIGEGVRQFVMSEFTQFGTNIIAVVPGKSNTFGTSAATINTVRPLTIDDAQSLRRLPNVLAVVPTIQGNANVEFEGRQRRAMVFGVTHDMPVVWKMDVRSGQFLPDGDFTTGRSVAVLGAKMREELFGADNPLGARIRVGGERFQVLGVMESKGQMLGFDLDDTLFLPVAKAVELFDQEGMMEIDIVYAADADVAQIVDTVKRRMMQRHGAEDVTITTQDEMLEVLNSVLNVLTLGIGALGGISLLVGAVGILTIMTIAVTERTAEIGLLRAIGARRAHILGLFLAEAVGLGALGGIIGCIGAVGVVEAIAFLVPAMPVRTAWIYVLASLLLATLIGLASGIAPALRAARMLPLEALRAE